MMCNVRKLLGVYFGIKFVPMSFCTNVIMAILNSTTIAILRQLLATMKYQSRQIRQLVRLKNHCSRRQFGYLGIYTVWCGSSSKNFYVDIILYLSFNCYQSNFKLS